jgi:hypothetical protein
MAAKAKSPKKKSSGKKGTKGKAGADKSQATHLALMSVADDVDCRSCVIRTIEKQCNTTVGGLGDKLRDVCSPCDTGAMADLAEALRRNCGASGGLKLTCSMTIIQVIHAVCG